MRAALCASCGSKYDADEGACPACGEIQPIAGKTQKSWPLGYRQCDWSANGKQCRHPATISQDTRGEGQVFCSLHYACTDPAFGAQVVQASRDYVHVKPGLTEQDQLAAEAYCKLHGLNTIDDKRAFIRKCLSSIAARRNP